LLFGLQLCGRTDGTVKVRYSGTEGNHKRRISRWDKARQRHGKAW